MTKSNENSTKTTGIGNLAPTRPLSSESLSSLEHSDKYDASTVEGRVCALSDALGSAAALARAAGVSEGLVRKWRKGASEPKLSDLLVAAQRTGVSAVWLALGVGSPAGGSGQITPAVAGYTWQKSGADDARESVKEILAEYVSGERNGMPAIPELTDYVALARAVKIVEAVSGKPASSTPLGELAAKIEGVYRRLIEVSDS